MGKVQVDIYRYSRQWDYCTLSDIDAVKGLIMLRDKLDIYYNNRNGGYDVNDMNESLICLYVDLDSLINNCKFDEWQLALINMLSSGYTFGEIDEVITVIKNTRSHFNTICKHIVEENEKRWLIWVNMNYNLRGWIVCSKCKKAWPAIMPPGSETHKTKK